MTLTLAVTSAPKGSNPGGECTINGTGANFKAYYKHVYGPDTIHRTPFTGANQPIYEVLVNELAKQLGMMTARTYVLLNKNKDVVFIGWAPYNNRSPDNRTYYYVSHLINRNANRYSAIISAPADAPTGDEEQQASKEIEKQQIYLESILVDDIIGKRQNYVFSHPNGELSITYLDLGCGFVRATNGIASIPHKVKKFSTDHKVIKRTMKRLHGTTLIGADNNTYVDLGNLVDRLPFIGIPTLNPCGTLPLNALLTTPEISTIQSYLCQSMIAHLPKFKERGLILVDG